jgi:signal transduction histidine kinase
MALKWVQLGAEEAGYFDLFGGFKGLGIYAVLLLLLVGAVCVFDPGSVAGLIAIPMILGLAILAALLFQTAGAVASSCLIFLVFGYGCVARIGLFEALSRTDGLFFIFGFSLLTLALSLAVALAVGYSRRSTQISVQRQNLLYKIFNALPIGIWVRARDGRSLFVNERWASFSPHSVESILGSNSSKPPVDLGAQWDEEVATILNSDDASVRYQAVELTNASGDTSNMTLLTLRMFIEQEDDVGTLSLLVDETALRVYEEKVRQSEQNLHLALQNARMGFWDENVKTKSVRCDDNWYALLDAERLPGESALDVWNSRLHPDDRALIRSFYSKFYRKGEGGARVEYRMRKGSLSLSQEDYIWVQDSVRIAEYDLDGSPLRVMGTMQDISDQKQAELELKRAKDRSEMANQAKSQFIATVSHEIRTPLNAIIGLSSFLADGDLEGESLDLAQTIHSSGKSLLLLVNDILDFSKIESGHLDIEVQEFPLSLAFEESVKLFSIRAAEKGVALNLDLSQELTEFAMGDMERLRQIVQNLLANALKFTDAGSVRVTVKRAQLSKIDVANRPDPEQVVGFLDQSDHDYLEVRIEDTGIGIPLDRQHMLFEAFSQVDASATRKYGGTGWGLVICKRLVDAMGGRIWVESDEGQGACFCFVVRTKLLGEECAPAASTHSPFDPVGRIAERHPCDILVVGPEAETRPLIAICRQLGYVPHTTEDYDLSVGSFHRRQYTVTFIWMGDTLKALNLAHRLSSAGGMQRSGAVVGYASPETRISDKRCRLNGLQKVLPTNVDALQIRELILDLLCAHD